MKAHIAVVLTCLASIANTFQTNQITEILSQIVNNEANFCVYFIQLSNSHVNYLALMKSLWQVRNLPSSVCSIQDLRSLKSLSTCSNPLFVLIKPTELRMVDLSSHMSKSVWVVIHDSNMTVHDLFANIDVSFDAQVIAAKGKTDMTSVYRVAKGFPLRINPYDPGTHRDTRNKRYNLHGINISAASIHEEPQAFFDKNGQAFGFFPALWNILEPAMNFTSKIYRYIGTTGTMNKSGIYDGLIGDIISGTYDVILHDFFITPERMNVLDMSQTLMASRYKVYTRMEGVPLGYAALIYPFDKYLWTAIVVWVIAGAFFLYAASSLWSNGSFNVDSDWPRMGIIGSMLFLLQTLSNQSSPQVPKMSSLRIVFITAYLTSAVIVPSYSASFISSLTQRYPDTPFTALRDILNTKYELLVYKHSADNDFFTKSKDEVYQRIKKEKLRAVTKADTTTSPYSIITEILCNEQYTAGLASEEQMDYSINKEVRPGKPCRILKMEQNLPIVHATIAFQKGTPYLTAFNYKFLQLREFGILNREFAQHWSKFERPERTYHEISLGDTYPIFCICLLGIILSLFILIHERLRYTRLHSAQLK